MDKVRKNKSKKQGLLQNKEDFYNNLPFIIRETSAFDALQYHHKRILYAKLKEYFKPAKDSGTYYGWFRNPETIPAMGFEYIVNVMRMCLTETINDILTDTKIKVAELNLMLTKFEKYLDQDGTTSN